MFEHISLLPFFIATIVVACILALSIYNENLLKKSGVNLKKYHNPIFNKFHLLSYQFPYMHFVEDDDNLTPKGEKLLHNLDIAGLLPNFSPRSFMAMKVHIMLISVGLSVVVSTLLVNGHILTDFLLGIKSNVIDVLGYVSSIKVDVFGKEVVVMAFDLRIFIFMMVASLMPPLYLNSKISKHEELFSKHLPVLQMFIILMLRSKKTTSEILFGLSKINTVHKDAFKKAHRIYIRNQSEGLHFIKEHFSGNRFSESFSLLEEMGEFAREDILSIMSANLKNISDDVKILNQSKAGTKLLYSQASMVFPFAGVIILCAVPIVTYAFGLMNLEF